MEHLPTLSQIIERELGGIVVDAKDMTIQPFEDLILATVLGTG